MALRCVALAIYHCHAELLVICEYGALRHWTGQVDPKCDCKGQKRQVRQAFSVSIWHWCLEGDAVPFNCRKRLPDISDTLFELTRLHQTSAIARKLVTFSLRQAILTAPKCIRSRKCTDAVITVGCGQSGVSSSITALFCPFSETSL